MREMPALNLVLIDAGLDDNVGLMVDGRFSCGTYDWVAGPVALDTAVGVFYYCECSQ